MPRNKALTGMILLPLKNEIIFLMVEEKDKKKEDKQAIIYVSLPCSQDQVNVSSVLIFIMKMLPWHGSELSPSICSHLHNKQLQ
jgi:hypothetical protein